jgi:hypothetical protein
MTKNLMLAALAALSLSAGTAMAQDGPSSYFPDYQAAKILAAHQAHASDVQFGASDQTTMRNNWRLGSFHATPERPNELIGTGGGN